MSMKCRTFVIAQLTNVFWLKMVTLLALVSMIASVDYKHFCRFFGTTFDSCQTKQSIKTAFIKVGIFGDFF